MNMVVVRRHLRAVFAAWLVVSLALGQMLFLSSNTPEVGAQSGNLHYLALGDSVSSGHGLDDDGLPCRRSSHAYPWQVRSALSSQWGRVDFRWLACSGATVGDNPRKDENPAKEMAYQIDYAEKLLNSVPVSDPVLITFTFGANDIWGDVWDLGVNALAGDWVTSQSWTDNKVRKVEDRLYLYLSGILSHKNAYVVIEGIYNPLSFGHILREYCAVSDLVSCSQRVQYVVERLNMGYAVVKQRLGNTPRMVIDMSMYRQAPAHFANPCLITETLILPVFLETYFQNDCFHPNEAGTRVIANGVLSQARALLATHTQATAPNNPGSSNPPLPSNPPAGNPAPPAGTCTTNVNLTVQTALSVGPNPASVGQTVKATSVIKNNGSCNYSGQIYVGGHGPGGDNDFQDFQRIQLSIPAGGTVPYSAERSFAKAGKYHFTMGRIDYRGVWQHIPPGNGSGEYDLTVTAGGGGGGTVGCTQGVNLVVESSLTVLPTSVSPGQNVTANAVIRNNSCSTYVGKVYVGGHGPGGDNDFQDFALVQLTIPSGGTQPYTATRSFSKIGNYHFTMGRIDDRNLWQHIPPGAGTGETDISVTQACAANLVVKTSVSVAPNPASVGQAITAIAEIENTGCQAYEGNIYLGGRGPGGEPDIQDFPLQWTRIEPKSSAPYKMTRTFSALGNYQFTMGRVDARGIWQEIPDGGGSRKAALTVDASCRDAYSLSVEQDLTLSPQQAASWQQVTAQTVIVNKGCVAYEGTIYLGGRGPGGEPDIQDFPGQKVRIEPNGGTVIYEQSRSFVNLGSYSFVMGRTDEQGKWQTIPAGAGKSTGAVTLTTKCHPLPLIVTSSLELSEKDLVAGQTVEVTWTVKNGNPAECAPVTFAMLGTAVRGPGGNDDNRDMTYAKNWTIPSGQSFTYKVPTSFATPGEYRAWIAVLGADNVWYAVATTGPTGATTGLSNATIFTVKPGNATPAAGSLTVTPIPQNGGTVTSEPAPSDGGNTAVTTVPVGIGEENANGGTPQAQGVVTPATVPPTPLVVNGTVVPPAQPPTEIAIPVTPPSAAPVMQGSRNPSFSGDRLPVVASAGTDNATSPGRTQDDNPGTSWATWRWYPSNASFVLDLGQISALSGVKWMVLEPNQTPYMTIDISTDGISWTTIGTFSNLKQVSEWYGINATGDARYIRFALTNTTGQFMLGKISGVEVWGVQKAESTADGEQSGGNQAGGFTDPSFSGEQLAIASSDGTSNATSSMRAWDGDSGTSWATFSNKPQYAFFTLDLGAPMAISGIKWMVLETGYSDWLDVSMSADGVTWVPVGRFGNPASAYSWIGAQTSGQAQYVRFTFTNVAGSSMLGKIAEVQVWGGAIGAPAAAQAAASANGTPSTTAGKTPPATTQKTPPVTAGKTPPTTSKPTEKASAAQPKVNGPTKAPAKTPAKTSPTEPASARQPRVPVAATKAPTRPATQAGTTNEGAQQPAIETTGDQASVPTTVVEVAAAAVATTSPVAQTNPDAPTVTPTTANAFAASSTGSTDVTPTPIVFDGDQPDGPTVTPIPDTSGDTGDSGPTVTPTVAAGVVTPTVVAADAVTEPPTPIVFGGDQPDEPTVTPVPDGDGPTVTPVTETSVSDEPVTETPVTETPTAIVFGGGDQTDEAVTETVAAEAVTETVPAEAVTATVAAGAPVTETPTAIVFGGGEQADETVTKTPADVVVTETVIAGVMEDVTETLVAEEITPTPTVTPTETPSSQSGSLYEVGTETPVDAAADVTTQEPEIPAETVTETVEAPVEELVTETPVDVPTEMPTEIPTPEVTPLSIITIGDSEGTQNAYIAADFDPNTVWSVYPSVSPTEVRLTLDLGQMQPVSSIGFAMDGRGLLPNAELWLSEDGITWWNVTSFDARQIEQNQPGQPVTVPLGYWTRYVSLVVPFADTLGMPEIGGIAEIQVWAAQEGEAVRNLADAGQPTTPVPAPTAQTEVIPTEAVTEAPFVEGTVPPVETEVPVGGGDGGDGGDIVAPGD